MYYFDEKVPGFYPGNFKYKITRQNRYYSLQSNFHRLQCTYSSASSKPRIMFSTRCLVCSSEQSSIFHSLSTTSARLLKHAPLVGCLCQLKAEKSQWTKSSAKFTDCSLAFVDQMMQTMMALGDGVIAARNPPIS